MGSRIYVGNLSSRVTERELEQFFKGFGRIKDVMMKSGFGFVEFDDNRDADDAVHEQNGRELMGNRVVVELSRRKPESRFGYGRRDGGGGGGGGYGGGRGGGYRDDRSRDGGVMSRDGRVNGRFPPPMQTRFRMVVTNLSTRCSWQDIKDMMRMDGKVNVTYADAHKRARNEALLCFANHDDLRYAMDKFQGKEINGRRIKIVDDTEGDRSGGSGRRGRSRSRSGGSRSRSRSRSSHRSRSRSRSGGRRSRSRSERRSRSRSPPSRSRSRTASSKGSRAKNGGGSVNGNKDRKQSRSRSASAASSKSGGRGGGSPKKEEMDE